ncbi:MAG: hypothetical protein ACYTEG_09100 [Planctomycetota bacterium]
MAALLLFALTGSVVSDLESYATWCHKNNLRASRDEAYEALLRFAPDHREARKRLKYRWDKKQLRWVRKSKYKRPPQPEGELGEQARARWEALTQKFADDVLADKSLKGVERARRLADARALAPDYEPLRTANGEVRRGDDWVLLETARSRERIDELDEIRRDLLAKLSPPTEGIVTAEDKKFGIEFPTAWIGGSWRVLGTVPPEECKELLRFCDAAHPFLNRVFELSAAPPKGLSLYVLKQGQIQALETHPAYTDAERKFVLKRDGSWVPGAFAFVVWSPHSVWRRDVVVRSVFGLYLKHRFGLTAKHGWAWEGFTSLLTYELAGTRLAITVQRGAYERDRKTREAQLRTEKFRKTDWARLARDLFRAEKKPDLRVLASKEINTISADESLLCFAMAQYLATGFPDKCGAFLKAYGSGIDIDKAMASHLGFDFHGFEKRFARWLEER